MSAPRPEVRHPLFARFCAVMTRKEPAVVREHRRELLSGLSGRVLELGAGAGANFAFYPADPVAARHGASVVETTRSSKQAYADRTFTGPRERAPWPEA